ncbi:MAG: Spy/CpxP family protein refolding chaperone [Candidatus Omnitrophica bacterium]|jgi:Spy/CpxP family protein refolding chaperone|nr:Spy/CpxP family protein refolding chaperone [Candidatus Omnitrophota bacterium]
MRKAKVVMIGLGLFFLTANLGYAQMQDKEPPSGGRLKEGIYKELNLTSQQQSQLEANRKAHRQAISQLRAAMKEKNQALQQALKDPAVTNAKVEPLVSQIKSLQAQLIDQRISGIFAVKEILNPEQFAKFNQLAEKRKEGRNGRFQKQRGKPENTEDLPIGE